MSDVLPGAEPWSAPGDERGVLVVHGFTGNPQSMRPLAEAFAAEGWTVELPLLPGHGTSVDDMLATRWEDWSQAAEAAYVELAGRCRAVVVAGLSMGGTLTTWLAQRHPEIAGIVLVNPLVDATTEGVRGMRDAAAAETAGTWPAIGSDISREGTGELAYDATPVQPLLSLLDATAQVQERLADVRCPVLLLTSPQDHVVDPVSSDTLAAGVSGPVRRVALERSYHVATLDHDAALLEREAVAFARHALDGG